MEGIMEGHGSSSAGHLPQVIFRWSSSIGNFLIFFSSIFYLKKKSNFLWANQNFFIDGADIQSRQMEKTYGADTSIADSRYQKHRSDRWSRQMEQIYRADRWRRQIEQVNASDRWSRYIDRQMEQVDRAGSQSRQMEQLHKEQMAGRWSRQMQQIDGEDTQNRQLEQVGREGKQSRQMKQINRQQIDRSDK